MEKTSIVSIASGIGIVLLWFGGALRTTEFGFELKYLIFWLILFGIFSITTSVSLLGTTKKAASFAIAITLSMIFLVEGFAGAQELIASQSHECPDPEGSHHFETRWWPNQANGFFCKEDGSWIGHD